MNQSIILCADDFGINPEVCIGILELVRKQKLSAVSCMVNLPDFKRYSKELLDLKKQVQVGLHFNLTEGHLISGSRCFSLKELLIKTHLSLLKPSIIAQELNAQLSLFQDMMGCPPDFIDGHQHIHQFPVIRQVVLDFYEQHLRPYNTYIRSTYPIIGSQSYPLKTKILKWTGGRALHLKLQELNIPHNDYFAGIYDFNPNVIYGDLFRQWVGAAPKNTLIMCHPAKGINAKDEIGKARQNEWNYLISKK